MILAFTEFDECFFKAYRLSFRKKILWRIFSDQHSLPKKPNLEKVKTFQNVSTTRATVSLKLT